MDIKELMSGIAVVIDDALDHTSLDGEGDQIDQIVKWFEKEWELPFVRMTNLPRREIRPNLLQSASFVLLDWRLWGGGGDMLREDVVNEILEFLKSARESLVPVFILTNENPDDVMVSLRTLPNDVFDANATNSNFVFVKQKSQFWTGEEVDVQALKAWVYGNAAIYSLKTWHQVVSSARGALFRAMCRRSVNWPRVFWRTFKTDGVDPSASLMHLINDSLHGRMQVDAFENEHLDGPAVDVSDDELRRLIAETSFLGAEVLLQDEVRCGDLYKKSSKKYWLNLRADCDCIPRGNGDVGDIEVHCIEGKRLTPGQVGKDFEQGHIKERVFQSVVFGIIDGNSICFDFRKVTVCKYSDIKEKRVGRLLHPYVTRVQQRYAFYIQRQALPRIPDAAIPPEPEV